MESITYMSASAIQRKIDGQEIIIVRQSDILATVE